MPPWNVSPASSTSTAPPSAARAARRLSMKPPSTVRPPRPWSSVNNRPCRSLVPTIEIVISSAAAARRACEAEHGAKRCERQCARPPHQCASRGRRLVRAAPRGRRHADEPLERARECRLGVVADVEGDGCDRRAPFEQHCARRAACANSSGTARAVGRQATRSARAAPSATSRLGCSSRRSSTARKGARAAARARGPRNDRASPRASPSCARAAARRGGESRRRTSSRSSARARLRCRGAVAADSAAANVANCSLDALPPSAGKCSSRGSVAISGLNGSQIAADETADEIRGAAARRAAATCRRGRRRGCVVVVMDAERPLRRARARNSR